jgi:hypothetical protein
MNYSVRGDVFIGNMRAVGSRRALAICASIAAFSAGCTATPDAGATETNGTTTPAESETTSTTASTTTTMVQVTTTTTLAVKLPAQGAIFGDETGVLLLLDDGIDGLTAVDPDRRLAGRSVVEGQRAGDEPYSMVRVGDKLVVGWGEPHAIDIATRQAISLGTATIFVPAAEPNRVWMIDYGARIGDREPQVWQVDVVFGEPLQDPIALAADGHPQIGITGGLALQTESGLELWDIETGQTTTLETDGPGFVHDVNSEVLIWCRGECSTLSVTNTSTFQTDEFDPPAGYEMFLGSSRISPSGRYIASLVGRRGSYEGKAIWILDREIGDTTVVSDPETNVRFLAWAPDGDQLFATSNSYSQALTVVWRYQISDQEFTAVVLPFGGGISLVAVDGSAVDAYIAGEPVDTSQCRAPDIQPSGRSGICIFGY